MASLDSKFALGDRVHIPGQPGYGIVVMVDISARRYLLNCYPGACCNYIWVKIRHDYMPPDGALAANWFDEDELQAWPEGDVRPSKGGAS